MTTLLKGTSVMLTVNVATGGKMRPYQLLVLLIAVAGLATACGAAGLPSTVHIPVGQPTPTAQPVASAGQETPASSVVTTSATMAPAGSAVASATAVPTAQAASTSTAVPATAVASPVAATPTKSAVMSATAIVTTTAAPSTAVPSATSATPPTAAPATSVTATSVATPSAQSAPQSILGTNLIVNGNAETGPSASKDSVVVPPSGWKVNGSFTTIKYGASGVLATTDPGPDDRGASFFAGGPGSELASASQTINVSAGASDIDSGQIRFVLAGYLGGYEAQGDSATVAVTFKGADNQTLSTATIGPSTPADRKGVSGLVPYKTNGGVPRGTRSIDVTVTMKRVAGFYNDGYADDLSLVLRGVAA